MDSYKKGGRVKKPKGKKVKAKAKARKTPKKRAPRRTQATATGSMPTTGMGSVVFGATQAPSYFRAIGPQQEFGNIPDVLKGLKQGQENIMKELDRRKAQEATDRVFANQVQEEEEVRPTPKKVLSASTTPRTNYDFSFASPLNIQLPNTLNRLEQQRSVTPNMMTPMGDEFQPPMRAFPNSYEGDGKEEAMAPYAGADESLPPQQVASGEQMVPNTSSITISSSSAFVPLGASLPESQGDSAKRITGIKRPVVAVRTQVAAMAANAVAAVAGVPPGDVRRVRVQTMNYDELRAELSRLGVANPRKLYTGQGSVERMKADILARY